MKILTKKRDNFTMVIAAGQMNVEDEKLLLESVTKVINQGKKHIAINLGNTSYLTSQFIGCLFNIRKKLLEINGDLQIIVRNLNLRVMLESNNINKVIKILDSEKELPKTQNNNS